MGLDKTGDFYLVDLFGGGSRGEAEDFLWPCEWRGLGWLGLGVYRASQLKRFAAAEAQAHCLLLPLTPFSVGSNPSPSPVRHITPDLVPPPPQALMWDLQLLKKVARTNSPPPQCLRTFATQFQGGIDKQ